MRECHEYTALDADLRACKTGTGIKYRTERMPDLSQ